MRLGSRDADQERYATQMGKLSEKRELTLRGRGAMLQVEDDETKIELPRQVKQLPVIELRAKTPKTGLLEARAARSRPPAELAAAAAVATGRGTMEFHGSDAW